jgi:phage shock protein A
MLEKDVARVGRKYGQATARVRRLRAGLKKAEAEVRELRRQMRLLISARKV